MANDALHVLTLERAVRSSELPPSLAGLLRRQWSFALLGAVLVDLPYFEGFLGRVVDDLLGREDRGCPWGDRLHRQGAVALAEALLLEAQQSEAHDALVALALGHLTHVRLDVATHPLVNRLVAASPATMRPGALHRTIETVQVELWHRRIHGGRLFGSGHAHGLLAQPAEKLGQGPVGEAVARAFRRVFGLAPTPGLWSQWSFGLKLYALAVAGPAGALHVRASALRDGERWVRARGIDFDATVEDAIAGMTTDMIDAFAIAQSIREHPERFRARFPEQDLDCLEVAPARPLELRRATKAKAAQATYL
jgi:hypothetical protein